MSRAARRAARAQDQGHVLPALEEAMEGLCQIERRAEQLVDRCVAAAADGDDTAEALKNLFSILGQATYCQRRGLALPPSRCALVLEHMDATERIFDRVRAAGFRASRGRARSARRGVS